MLIDVAERNALAMQHYKLARSIAKRYAHVAKGADFDDLAQEACIALIDACEKYDPASGSFIPYAYSRILGGIRDYVRKRIVDPVGRYSRQSIRELSRARQELGDELQRTPTAAELCRLLDWEPAFYEQVRVLEVRAVTTSTEDPIVGPDGTRRKMRTEDVLASSSNVEGALCENESREELRAIAATLKPRERFVFQRSYFEHESHRAIARSLGVSESRVSQIVSSARFHIRQRLLAAA